MPLRVQPVVTDGKSSQLNAEVKQSTERGYLSPEVNHGAGAKLMFLKRIKEQRLFLCSFICSAL